LFDVLFKVAKNIDLMKVQHSNVTS